MATNKPNIYAAGVTFLGFICFAISATAVGLPTWAYFEAGGGSWESDKGYFGPWRVCKRLSTTREKCGNEVSRFRPSQAVYISGLIAVFGCICFGLFCILSILQIAMISSRERIVMKYSVLVIFKLILAFVGTVLSLVSAGLFAFQTDDDRSGYRVTRGLSFYLQILTVALSLGLFTLSIYDLMLSKKPDGDPTMLPNLSSTQSTTYNNPGFRENHRTNGVSVTDSSGRPYSNGINGSVQSMSTTMTSMSNGSTIGSVTRTTPLRSSLKRPKPKPEEGLGIQNPGFSGANQSPRMQRSGSVVKKVRIQTHSTEV